MRSIMGVDVGGTKILIGMVSSDGKISHERRYPSKRGTQELAVSAVTDAVIDYWHSMVEACIVPKPEAIGMGLVGQVDYKNGIWVHSLATPITTPYPICKKLSLQLGVPVYADNDVHCATLAEIRFGAGIWAEDFVYLNIGTGVAAGFVSEGRLIRGATNQAGEVGHMTVNMDMDIMCKCGRRGCMEEFASGGGMLRYARSLYEQYPDSALVKLDKEGQLFSSAVFSAAREGDFLAGHVAGLVMRSYIAVFQDIINLMDPAAIIVGGGVFRDELILPEIIMALRTWRAAGNMEMNMRIELSGLDPQMVGLLGASITAINYIGMKPTETGNSIIKT